MPLPSGKPQGLPSGRSPEKTNEKSYHSVPMAGDCKVTQLLNTPGFGKTSLSLARLPTGKCRASIYNHAVKKWVEAIDDTPELAMQLILDNKGQ